MLHRTFTIAAATAVASLLAAAPSLAATTPIPLSFDNLVLKAPAIGNAVVVSPTTQPLTVTAQVDPTTGDFSIDPSTFSAPTYNYSTPVTGSATLALANTATGNVNFSTGAVTLNADFIATLTIPSLGGSCSVNTGNLSLSTATTRPLQGTAFPAGPTGVATGKGALGAGWNSLAPGTGPSCATVDAVIDNGAGGVWISRGISPAQATPVVPPKISVKATTPKNVDAGRSQTVKVTLKNTGGPDTRSVKVCLRARRPLSTSRCQTVAKPGAKVTKTLSFKVFTTKATTAGRHLLTLTATGQKNTTVTLKVVKTARTAQPVKVA